MSLIRGRLAASNLGRFGCLAQARNGVEYHPYQGVMPFSPLLNATPFTAAASWIANWK